MRGTASPFTALRHYRQTGWDNGRGVATLPFGSALTAVCGRGRSAPPPGARRAAGRKPPPEGAPEFQGRERKRAPRAPQARPILFSALPGKGQREKGRAQRGALKLRKRSKGKTEAASLQGRNATA